MSLFKKKKPTAKVDSTVVIQFTTDDKPTIHELNSAIVRWKTRLGDEHKVFNRFNDMESTSKHFEVYFSMYGLELFLKFYKQLIDDNDTIPDSDGTVYQPAYVTAVIYYNSYVPKPNGKYPTTKDKFGNVRTILDSPHKLYTYKVSGRKKPIISEDFVSGLQLTYYLIYFYNYTPESLANQDDPKQEFKNCHDLAMQAFYSYKKENPTVKAIQLPKRPHYPQFERQDTDSIYIPALASPEVIEKEQQEGHGHDKGNGYFAKFASKGSEADLSSTERSMKAESDSIAKAEEASNASTSTSDSSEQASSADSSAQSAEELPSDPSKLKSEASYYKSLAETRKASQASAGALSTQASSEDLVDVHQFAKSHFPLTNNPKLIKGGIQLLMDKDPNMFMPDFQFKQFPVDNDMPAPEPIKQAIKTGKLDNQRYVIQMDNQNRRIANSVINSRAKVLNMGYARMLVDLLYGAYSKISKKTAILLQQTTDNDALNEGVQQYYNQHFNRANDKLEKDRKAELKAVHEGLYHEYMSKKRLKDNQINTRYNKEARQLDTKISSMAKDVFYKARAERNTELRQQISSLTASDLKKVRLQIKNHNISWNHKMSQASKILFNFLRDRLQGQHAEAIRVASKLISKQTELMDTQANIQQARAEMVRNRGNRKIRQQWAKQQAQQQSYINTLSGQVDQYTAKLTKVQSTNKATKNKLTQLIANNSTLQNQLGEANKTLVSNQHEIAKGRENLTKLNETKAQQAEQVKSFASARHSYEAENNSIKANTSSATALASWKASSSASAQIEAKEASVMMNNNSYQAKIFKLQQSLSSASSARDANTAHVQNQLSNAKQSLTNYQNEVSQANSIKNSYIVSHAQSVKQSVADRDSKYQNSLNMYSQALQSASQAQGDTAQLQSQLTIAQNSMSNYRASVSTSNSIKDASIASQNHSLNASVASKNGSYQEDMRLFSMALSSARQAHNGDVASYQSRLSMAKNSLTEYQNSVQDSNAKQSKADEIRSQSMSNSIASQSASYRDDLEKYSQAIDNASQANEDTTHLKNQLANAQTSLNDYRNSVSVSNSVKNSSIASYNDSVSASVSERNASYQSTMTTYNQALDSASQASGKTDELKAQLNEAQNSFDTYRSSVSASNSIKNSSIASHNASVNDSIATRNQSYQSHLNQYADALNSASQASANMAQFETQLGDAKSMFTSYQNSVSISNSAKDSSIASQSMSVANSISARNDNYQSKLNSYTLALSSASQANNNTTALNAKWSNAQESFESYRDSISASNAQNSSASESRETSLSESIANKNASYQSDLSMYAKALESASQASHDTKSATDQLSLYKSSLADYKSKVAQSDSIRSAEIANSQVSASLRDSSYKARIDNMMTSLRQASQANANTDSAQANLEQYKSAFSSFQSSVSTANSLKDVAMSNSNRTRNDSYKATISLMKSNEAQASKANSYAMKTNQSNASFNASAKSEASHYRSTIDSYKSMFKRYKASVSASSSSERRNVSASNSTTSSMMSSATFGSSRDTNDAGKTYDTGQSYNPKADELEQERLLNHEKEQKQNVQQKKKQVAEMHKKHRKILPFWKR